MPFKTTFNFVLVSLYLFQVNAFGDSSERYSMKSSAGGYTSVEPAGGPVGDFTCDSDNNHPVCSKSMGGLIMKDTPANRATGMQLTGPFAPRKDSRPDAPAEGRYTITNKDDGGKYIVVEYMKGSRTTFTAKQYYEYSDPSLGGGKGKGGESSDSDGKDGVTVLEASDDNTDAVPSKFTLTPGHETGIPEGARFDGINDSRCVNPDDPSCR